MHLYKIYFFLILLSYSCSTIESRSKKLSTLEESPRLYDIELLGFEGSKALCNCNTASVMTGSVMRDLVKAKIFKLDTVKFPGTLVFHIQDPNKYDHNSHFGEYYANLVSYEDDTLVNALCECKDPSGKVRTLTIFEETKNTWLNYIIIGGEIYKFEFFKPMKFTSLFYYKGFLFFNAYSFWPFSPAGAIDCESEQFVYYLHHNINNPEQINCGDGFVDFVR